MFLPPTLFELRQLEDKLSAFEQTGGAQVVLLLVPTTQPENIASDADIELNPALSACHLQDKTRLYGLCRNRRLAMTSRRIYFF